MMTRMPLPEVRFFAIVIAIQQQAGGNLSEALGNLSGVLRDRKRLQAKVRALSAEAKASAAVLGALPFVVMILVYITTPAYITPALDHEVRPVPAGRAPAVWMTMRRPGDAEDDQLQVLSALTPSASSHARYVRLTLIHPPQIVVTLLAAVAAFATALTVLMPVLSRDRLNTPHAGHGHRARQDARRAPCRPRQEGRPGPAADRAQGLHAGDRRQAQSAQRVRDRGGARQAEDGRPARPGAARRLHVLPRGHAGDHRRRRAALPVRDRRLRLSARWSRSAWPSAPATSASTCPTCSSQNLVQRRQTVDQERLPGRARHAADLRAVGHVGRGRVQKVSDEVGAPVAGAGRGASA